MGFNTHTLADKDYEFATYDTININVQEYLISIGKTAFETAVRYLFTTEIRNKNSQKITRLASTCKNFTVTKILFQIKYISLSHLCILLFGDWMPKIRKMCE